MAGYEPVTIESVCNAGVDALEDAAGDLPLGRVELRGLPFLIGSDTPSKERCFVVPTAPVSIEVGRTARRVIIAHRLLKPGGPAGHGVGTPVADYVFHLAGGERSRCRSASGSRSRSCRRPGAAARSSR